MDFHAKIKTLATEAFEEVVASRRHIHQHPELSFQEAKTAAFVKEKLEEMDIPCTAGVAGHGVVGLIEGKTPGRTIALRADMDALPITEANEVPYRSGNQGVMHACGHDAHTASLLGTARILSQVREHFPGTIKLIFQPAEERLPGGASLMIREGVLTNPDVSGIIGQHVLPYLPAGKVGIRPGMYMASADEIYLRIKGKGGHAAHPGTFIDPVVMAAQVLVTLQQVVSRSDPRIPSVLSFGKIIAEGATNIIPSEVYIEGTLRTMDEDWRAQAHERIEAIVNQVCSGLGGSAEIEIRKGYPVLNNNESLTRQAAEWITEYAGEENLVDLDLWMAAEDFAWYTHEVPGCFYRIGTGNEARGITHGLHTPRFDIDESALELSTGLMAWMAIQALNSTEQW